MSVVSFPGLGLSFELNRAAFTIGTFSVYWYGIIIMLGFALGVGFCCLQAEKFGMKSDDIIDVILLAGPGGIIGARIYYIIFNLEQYRNASGGLSLMKCLDVHGGGLAIYGGIIAGTLLAFAVARRKKIPFPAVADVYSFGLLIGQCIGRWGNFVNAEAHGGETDLPWRMGIETVVNGTRQYMEVHPTFLYESLWNLVGLLLLMVLLSKGVRRFDGEFFLLYVAWYGLGRSMIEGLRTDSLYLFSTGLRTSQVLALCSFAAAVIILILVLRTHPDKANLYVNRRKNEP